MAKKFLSTLKIVNLPSDPISGSEGELYFDTSASVAKIYQAGAWSVLGAGGGGTTVSTTEPESPEIGDSWYKNDTGEFYVYDGTYWVEVNGVIEPYGVTSLLGTANEINVSASIGNIIIGIPDSPVFVTPNIGVATATSINGTTIPSSASLVVSTDLNNYLTQDSASTTYLTQSSASTIYSITSHNHTLDSLSNVEINSLTDGDAIIWSSASSAWINQVGGTGAGIIVSTTAPEDPETGTGWYNNETGVLAVWDGTYWVDVNGVISLTQEQIQDYVAPLLDHSNHSNLTATYDDENNQILLSAISDVNSISGTGNEINVSASVGNITIGLPDDVTISNDLTVLGNLLVSGSTTTLNTTELLVEDNIITLNSGVSGSPSINAGIEVERGVLNNVSIRWNESLGVWEYTNDGTIYNELGSGSGALYQDEAPEDAEIGTIWVDSNANAAIINTNDFVLKSEVEAYVPHTFLLMGG
jgi:hypothetical protein